MTKNNRVLWVDVLKGIGILLVILGHQLLNEFPLFKYIYSFHMPLFFFLSGLLFGTEFKKEKFVNFIKKKQITLLRPYFIFGFFSLFIYTIYNKYDISGLKGLYIANRKMMQSPEFNVPLWFLPCLFIVSTLFYLLHMYIKNEKIVMIICGILSMIGYKTLTYPLFPGTIDNGLYYIFFVELGYIVRGKKSFFKKALKYCFPIVLILNIYAYFYNQFYISYVLNYLIDVTLAISGIGVYTAIAIVISKQFKKLTDILSYFGKNSLLFMALHNPVRDYFYCILLWAIKGNFEITRYTRIGNFVGTIVCCIPLVWIINVHFPGIIGKRNTRKIIGNESGDGMVEKTKKRIEWVDVAKGLVMLLIVYGHNLHDMSICFRLISIFAVPTFMFLSGWFHNQNVPIKEFIYKKQVTLVRPYYIFGGGFLCLYTMYRGYDISGLKALYMGGKTILQQIEFDAPLWFLLCLFIVSIYYYVLRRFIKNDFLVLVVLIFMSCIGRNYLIKQAMPFSMDTALYWVLFYGLGNLARANRDKIKINRNGYLWLLGISVITIVMYLLYGLEIERTEKFVPIPYLIEILTRGTGIFVVLQISRFIAEKTKIIKEICLFYGVNSLVVTAIHNPIRDYGYGVLIWGLSGSFYQGILYREIQTLGTLILCIPVIIIINQYFSNIVGKIDSQYSYNQKKRQI